MNYPRSSTRAGVTRLTALVVTTFLALTACTSPSAAPEDAALTMRDAWVKAAESGMTAVFGTLVNDAAEPVTVVSASCAAADRMELHETAMDDSGQMVMREVDGGFVVPAGGQRELAPGSDHLMLLGIVDPIEPGEDLTITLDLDDGSQLTFSASARSFSGAEETYDDGAEPEQ